MSKTQQNAQSKSPLGGGEKAEASGSNRILYALLIVLVGVFIWKMASQEEKTQTIDVDISSPKDVLLDLTEESTSPNVEVEIQEADFKEVTSTPTEEDITRTANTEMNTSSSSSEVNSESFTYSEVEETQASYDVGNTQEYGNDSHYDSGNTVNDDFSYIYTSKVEIPQGSYAGMDNEGFARTNNVNIDVEVNQFDGATGTLQRIPEEEIFASNTISNIAEPSFSPPVKKEIQYPTFSNNVNEDRGEEYPSTGIAYGTEAYPLKDTLAWHPYESLAYKREEKETFVAEKVRTMPTADDLEPYIPPSTLGDRDTRMGFGVVIRPNK